MKNLLLFIMIAIISPLELHAQIYVSPNGSDSNSGSIDKPLKTIVAAVSNLKSPSTIYLRGGVYFSTAKINLSKIAQPENYYNLFAYPGEKVIIDFSGTSSDGISLSGKYWHLKSLEIKNAGHNGINISGSYNIIENCEVHNNKNTGVQMGSGSSSANPGHNLILNCDSYFNFDPPIGGNADGFGAKWNIGNGNIFKGCRSFNNSDDGWDFWMADSSIEIDSCIAFRNGIDIWHTGQVNGNGNGFKLGGNYIPSSHIIKNCISFDNAGNTGRGFDENNNTAGQTIYNCTAYRNKAENYYFNNTLIQGVHTIKNCISYLGSIKIKSGKIQNNSWQGFNVTTNDFLSIDTSLVLSPRDSNGNLQSNNFFRLAPGSLLIDAGVDVGIPYNGKAPDLGAYESISRIDLIKQDKVIPFSYNLYQNYPNPFNPATIIKFNIEKEGMTNLNIFDILGKEVMSLVHKNLNTGQYTITVNSNKLKSGIYIYKLESGGKTLSKKMILLK